MLHLSKLAKKYFGVAIVWRCILYDTFMGAHSRLAELICKRQG